MDDTIEASIERYRAAVPERLQALAVWLVWRFESAEKAGEKARKVPYYANGRIRRGIQGAPDDLAQLVSFDAALDALRSGRWSGLGVAHVPGCGLNSWDFDNCIDAQGAIAPDLSALLYAADTYVEISPSGRGVRMVALGRLPSVKRIHPGGYNIELFGESGFVTITGHTLAGDDVRPLPDKVEQTLRTWLQADLSEQPHTRTDQLAAARAADPIYQHMKAAGAIKRDWPDGRSSITCPFEAEHTSGAGRSDTVYFLPHTNGYAAGHFRCLHAHCAQRSDAEYRAALGVHEVDLSALLGVAVEAPAVHLTIDWVDVARNPPKQREWAIEGWLAIGAMTVLAGRGGIGKTLAMQQMASRLALGQEFLGAIDTPRNTLQWCAEDDADELKRRQLSIAEWCHVPIGQFQNALYIEPLAGVECSLAEIVNGALRPTKSASRLWEQINDLEVGVFFLDNIAHLYGGNENDRHQVTIFMNMLTGMCLRAQCSGVIAGHPAKSSESEFSGSTAWENAVRSRLYLSRTPPDVDEKDAEPDSDVRYLSKRKANYSSLDCVRLTYLNGVLRPDVAQVSDSPMIKGLVDAKARRVVMEAVAKLKEMQQFGGPSSQHANFLPKMIRKYQLSQGLHPADLEKTMRQLMVEGELVIGVVGKYANRNDKLGLVAK